jgi:hypothetical protein
LETYHSSVTNTLEINLLKEEDITILPPDSAVYGICTFHIYSQKNGKFDYESVKNVKDLSQRTSLGQSGADALKWTDSLIGEICKTILIRKKRITRKTAKCTRCGDKRK